MARKTRVSNLQIAGLVVEVSHKSMKYVRLKVCSPGGEIKVSAPHNTSMTLIEQFVREKRSWIRSQQELIHARPAPSVVQFQDGEELPIFGAFFQIKLVSEAMPSGIEVCSDTRTVRLMARLDPAAREQAVDNWYRQQLTERIPLLISRWQPVIGKQVAEWRIRKMKTRWGTCNIQKKRIWLNLELAKKPLDCLEYVVVHEMTHLYERYHNHNFYRYMDSFLPDWRSRRRLLNSECFK